MEALRRVTIASLAAFVLVGLALAVLFLLVLEPPPEVRCNTRLAEGPYRTALAPAYLLAAATFSVFVALLSAVRAGDRRRPGRPTQAGLAAAWLLALACLLSDGAMRYAATVAFFGFPLTWIAGFPLLAAWAGMTANLEPHKRWRRWSVAASALMWVSLVLGVPAGVAYAYVSAVDLFCF